MIAMGTVLFEVAVHREWLKGNATVAAVRTAMRECYCQSSKEASGVRIKNSVVLQEVNDAHVLYNLERVRCLWLEDKE